MSAKHAKLVMEALGPGIFWLRPIPPQWVHENAWLAKVAIARKNSAYHLRAQAASRQYRAGAKLSLVA